MALPGTADSTSSSADSSDSSDAFSSSSSEVVFEFEGYEGAEESSASSSDSSADASFDSDSSSAASDRAHPRPAFDSDSSASDSSSSSSSSGAALAAALAPLFMPRRFGPRPPEPMFVREDPFRAARTAFLTGAPPPRARSAAAVEARTDARGARADALMRSGRAPVPTMQQQPQAGMPQLMFTFEMPQPRPGGILLLLRQDGSSEAEQAAGAQHERDAEALEEEDMGAPCAIMMLATVAFFAGALTCCVRACAAACPRRAACQRQARQLVVDCSAGELASPLLLVDEMVVVEHTKA